MDFNFADTLSMVLFSIFFIFVVFGLYVLKKMVLIVARTFEEKTKTNIFYAVYGMLSFTLISILFWQAVSLKIVTFQLESTELYIRMGLALIQIGLGFWLLGKIVKSIDLGKEVKANKTESK